MDGADFQGEIVNMGSIYGNAYVTIAVESSESHANRLLHQCTPGRVMPSYKIPISLPSGDEGVAVSIYDAEISTIPRTVWNVVEYSSNSAYLKDEAVDTSSQGHRGFGHTISHGASVAHVGLHPPYANDQLGTQQYCLWKLILDG